MIGDGVPSRDRADLVRSLAITTRPTAPTDAFALAIQRRQADAVALLEEIEDRGHDWELAVPCQSARCGKTVAHVVGLGSQAVFVATIKQRPGDEMAPWAADVYARDPEVLPWPGRLSMTINGVAAIPQHARGTHSAPFVTMIYDAVSPSVGSMPGLWARCDRERCSAFEVDRRGLMRCTPEVLALRTWRHTTTHL